jgi:hypothetical protein
MVAVQKSLLGLWKKSSVKGWILRVAISDENFSNKLLFKPKAMRKN